MSIDVFFLLYWTENAPEWIIKYSRNRFTKKPTNLFWIFRLLLEILLKRRQPKIMPDQKISANECNHLTHAESKFQLLLMRQNELKACTPPRLDFNLFNIISIRSLKLSNIVEYLKVPSTASHFFFAPFRYGTTLFWKTGSSSNVYAWIENSTWMYSDFFLSKLNILVRSSKSTYSNFFPCFDLHLSTYRQVLPHIMNVKVKQLITKLIWIF